MGRFHFGVGAFSLALGIGLLASTASANLITNGDFQTGDITGWSTSGGQINNPGGTVVEANTGPGGAGDFALHVTSTSFSRPIIANGQAILGSVGVTYNYSFDVKVINVSGSWTTDIYFQKAFGGDFPAAVIVQNASPLNDGLWHTITGSFTTDGTTGGFRTGILTEGGGGGTTRDFYFDNFQVNDAAAAPEPASLALLGLGGLALMVRRRRAI